jgi:hypothetical protein
MCSHSSKIKESIDHLMLLLYPKVKMQFDLIDSCYGLGISNEEKERNAIIGLLNDMQTEFNSLYTCEARLVFPSILNAIENCKIELQNYHPNITDLVYLTKKKEQRLNQLTIELVIELNKQHFEDINQHVKILNRILQKEFMESKQYWNALMQDCLKNCSSFKFNNLSEIKT